MEIIGNIFLIEGELSDFIYQLSMDCVIQDKVSLQL